MEMQQSVKQAEKQMDCYCSRKHYVEGGKLLCQENGEFPPLQKATLQIIKHPRLVKAFVLKVQTHNFSNANMPSMLILLKKQKQKEAPAF